VQVAADYSNNPDMSSLRWSQFLFEHCMQDVTPATLPVALQEQSRCAHAIFEFNRWRWVISCNAQCLCEHGQDVRDRHGTLHADVLQRCPAFGRALVKRCIQDNALFARLINKDNLKFETLEEATWNSALTNYDWHAIHDWTKMRGGGDWDGCWEEFYFDNMFDSDTSPVVQHAVYGERHGGLVDAFFQVALGFAGLDTPVPRMFAEDPVSIDWEKCHSGWEGEVGRLGLHVEYCPLRVWLQETADWLGNAIRWLVYSILRRQRRPPDGRPVISFGRKEIILKPFLRGISATKTESLRLCSLSRRAAPARARARGKVTSTIPPTTTARLKSWT
jgi:hypothetical protein